MAQEHVVHAVVVLDAQDEGDGRVVEQVLADVGRVDDRVDAVPGELERGADAAEHEQLGGLEDALREDDLAGGVEVQLLEGGVDDGHALARTARVED